MKTCLALPITAVLLVATASPSSSAFSLSFVEDLLSDIGVSVDLPEVDIDLPPRAEEAISSALGRAESALDGILDDINLPSVDLPNIDLPEIDIPDVNIPDVDQIVQDALGRANSAAAEARARAQSEIDAALGRARNFLGDQDLLQVDQLVDQLIINPPNIEIPNLDIPIISLPTVSLPDVSGVVEDVLEDARGILDDIDVNVPEVGSIVDDALGRADGILDGILDDVNGTDVEQIVEDALGTAEEVIQEATGVVEQVLDGVLDRDPLNDVLNNLPEDILPSSVFTTLETIFGRVDSVLIANQPAFAVPEPTSGVLMLFAGAVGFARRRR